MRLTTFGVSVAFGALAMAFKDTSPYLLLSTSKLPSKDNISSVQLQLATGVLKNTKQILNGCPSDAYIIISQPNVTASDLESSTTVPYLRKATSSNKFQTKLAISELVGHLDVDGLRDMLASHCGADVVAVSMTSINLDDLKSSKPVVIQADLPPPSDFMSDREEQLAENDALLQTLILSLPTSEFTLIYTTTPSQGVITKSEPAYEPIFQETLHMDLKRQSSHAVRADDISVSPNAPLFVKYQFFTPGLFMGLLVAFLLLSILGIAIAGVASLQVSYAAFDKEMGPAAQKKMQ